MRKTLQLLACIFILTACSTGQNLSSGDSALQTESINSSRPATATLPAPTSTLTPTATATLQPVPDLPPLSNDQIKSRVDRLAARFLRSTGNAGLSIAIVLRNPATGKLESEIFNYGVTSDQTQQPVTSDTIYEVGSITKVFTGILLAQDVLAAKVKLDDPIQMYLPPDITAPTFDEVPITLIQLATHRSGLPRVPDKFQSADPFAEGYSTQDLYAWLDQFRLTREPGSQYEYSNMGYGLLGDILSQLGGTDYDLLEQKGISQPLGLSDTMDVLSSDQKTRLAQGYSDFGSPTPYFPDSGGIAGAAFLHSTIADMTQFLAANMEPDATPLAASLKLAQTNQAEAESRSTGIGLGWQISDPGQPEERIWKSGRTNGFTSYISFSADDSSGFVILTNGQFADMLAANIINLIGENPN